MQKLDYHSFSVKLWLVERKKSKTVITFSNLSNTSTAYAIGIKVNKINFRKSC